MAAPRNKLLLNIDFPVFVINSIGPKHFVIAGGGGQAGTGVPNGLEIVELSTDDDKRQLCAKSVYKFNSCKYAIMNCGFLIDSLSRIHLACGHDDKCDIYTIKQKVVTPRPNSPDGQLRKRKSGLTQADDFKNAKKIITFDVQLVDSVTTDFNSEDAYQNCAVFSKDGQKLATAGADGHIRMWQYPELTKLWETKAHEHEVEAMHIDPNSKQLCSTSSKDRKLLLWNAENGEQIAELKWNKEPTIKYKHKACKYCMLDKDPSKVCLFTIEVPVTHKKGAACYISQWNINRHKPITVQAVYCGTLSCMDISDDGKYLAVGSMEGDISVFDTANIKRLYHVNKSHKTFVTGVAFSPCTYAARLITRDSGFNLLSISIDNQVKLHQPPSPSWRRFKIFLVLFLLLVWSLTTFLVAGFASSIRYIRDRK